MGGADLVIASNRGPLSFSLDTSGGPVPGLGGGLAGALHPPARGQRCHVGGLCHVRGRPPGGRHGAHEPAGSRPGPRPARPRHLPDGLRRGVQLHAVVLPPPPLRPGPATPAAGTWVRGVGRLPGRCNRPFADAVARWPPTGPPSSSRTTTCAWSRGMLAEHRPDLRTVHFSHTPFADPDMLRVLPSERAGSCWPGMAGFGACGFHTGRWEAAYRAAAPTRASRPGRHLRLAASGPTRPIPGPRPLGRRAGRAGPTSTSWSATASWCVRVDRVELSKNLLRGFWAYDELLDTQPAVAGPGGDGGPRLRLARGAGRVRRLRAPRSSTPWPG